MAVIKLQPFGACLLQIKNLQQISELRCPQDPLCLESHGTVYEGCRISLLAACATIEVNDAEGETEEAPAESIERRNLPANLENLAGKSYSFLRIEGKNHALLVDALIRVHFVPCHTISYRSDNPDSGRSLATLAGDQDRACSFKTTNNGDYQVLSSESLSLLEILYTIFILDRKVELIT